jgi:hypothetical protein
MSGLFAGCQLSTSGLQDPETRSGALGAITHSDRSWCEPPARGSSADEAVFLTQRVNEATSDQPVVLDAAQ